MPLLRIWANLGPLSEGFERFVAARSNLVGYVRWDARSDRFPPCQTIIPTAFRSQSGLPVGTALAPQEKEQTPQAVPLSRHPSESTHFWKRRNHDTKTSIRPVHLTLVDMVESTCSFCPAFRENQRGRRPWPCTCNNSGWKAVKDARG
jgi:hypothetical protein